MSENYRRNADKKKKQTETRRVIPQTSTTVLMGATPADACFQGQDVKMGMARRFIFAVAESPARVIEIPPDIDVEPLVELFKCLPDYEGICRFSPEAEKLWRHYQRENRREISKTDQRRETSVQRLNSAPMQTLSVAMGYEACRSAKDGLTSCSLIRGDTLEMAIRYMAGALDAANYLDTMDRKEIVKDDAEKFLADVRGDWKAEAGKIVLTRSAINKKYALHSGRPGAVTVSRIYDDWIPCLTKQGLARVVPKDGRELYEFSL
jgi:hypothetical protein